VSARHGLRAVAGGENDTVGVEPLRQGGAEQSEMFSTSRTMDATAKDIDDQTAKTVNSSDLVVVEGAGLIAATLAAALSIRKLHGSSERWWTLHGAWAQVGWSSAAAIVWSKALRRSVSRVSM
jgi:hypothetical protein